MVTNLSTRGHEAETLHSAGSSNGKGCSSVSLQCSALPGHASNPAVECTDPLLPFEQLRLARNVVRTEGQALLQMAEGLASELCAAADLIFACRGAVIVCGLGKAGIVGQKIASTLASTGTHSHFLHPGEAAHGDLGRVQQEDVLLFLSFSG